ncbi:glycosyltransferase family 9 protein [Cetobacterium somerae]|uniref:glycosyltransferase family 9 protein n=1 Tax=Cetobacterium somerae TaxID=188913 RepID=UPI003D766928
MKILVVRFKQIGDAILSSVICKSLKETYPDAEIDYVLYDHVAPLFEHQKYLNKVISISKEEQKNPFKYLKKVWNVTRANYDIVIDIMSTPKSEAFTLFSGKAKYKIGRWKPKRGYTYTHSIPEPSSEYDKAEKFLKMLDPLVKEGVNVKLDKNYSLTFLPEEKEELKERMLKAGVDFSKILIPLAINSRRESKVYPVDLMKQLAQKLLETFDCQIILYYSPNEKEFAKKFHEDLNWDKRIVSDINTKSIRELGALLSNCDIFVGNEGGPRHLAQAIDIPSFSIFSPGSSKGDWLSRDNKRHEGIEPGEILSGESYENLSYEEKYRLITPDIILEKVKEKMLLVPKYIEKNKGL